MSTCSIEGCPNAVLARGWCVTHYQRWRHHGDPLTKMNGRGLPEDERFWRLVDQRGPDECWPWLGGVTSNGYGRFGRAKPLSPLSAHRYAYELAKGPIGEKMTIDHTCHNASDCNDGDACLHRRCCNPEHLEAVTSRANVLRGRTHPSANAAKTQCKYGHDFTPENTRISPRSGERICRACCRRRYYEYKARQ